MRKDYNLENRKYIVSAIAVIIVLAYIIRLFFLQVQSDEYKIYADSNAFLNKTQYPSRGAIYDRNGNLLVFDQTAYDITVIPNEIEDLDTLDFCQSLNISKEDFLDTMSQMRNKRKNPGYSKYTHQLFMKQLSPEECGVFQEKMFKYKGFYIQKRNIRQYQYNSAAHVLGDMGEVSPKDIENDNYYVRGDYIGKSGVESSYEKELRGKKGKEVFLRDSRGRVKGKYKDGEYDEDAISGNNIRLSLDINLQLLGEKLLLNKIGSIVALEPSTGEVLCLVSSPSFDPRTMSGKARGKAHMELQKDSYKPLLNRAITGTYPPGSTFKTAQGLIFLEEEIVDPFNTFFPCSNAFRYGNLKVGCHSHAAPITLIPSIATSCNSYYCWGLFRMFGNKKYGSPQNAITVWKDHMVSQGFGYRLGIDLPGEKRGLIPNAEFYDKAYKGRWNGLTVVSISIGQGEILATPLQIANLAATIANRGYFITPHVVREIEEGELDKLYTDKRYTTIDAKHYEHIVKGMRGAVTGGTCSIAGAILPGVEICGKTGTAENKGKSHSIYMGFAPMDNPKIAIAVYIENGGYGATYGVPIGTLMMDQYLNGKLSPVNEERVKDYSSRVIYYGTEAR